MKDGSRSPMRFLRSHKKTMVLIAVTAIATLIVSSLIAIWLDGNSGLRIPSVGTLRFEDVEAYWDENLTNKTGSYLSYNWGLMWPGATRNLTLFLRSVSNVETKFVRTETNWTFYNSSNIAVLGPSDDLKLMWMTWDYDNTTVRPGQVLRVTLTLHAESSSTFIEFITANEVQAFSFDIQISISKDN